MPDQRLIFPLSRLLDFKALSIQLTENGAMYPQSSTCGLYLSSPHAKYFAAGKY
ncbi:vitamin B12 dependent-methionine synthase activation domain-containing protein [Prevotella sp.]|uniref:vitamin B12 dependent-methionine synthase activation domain-containing protein n=1 Tax=Prevotella sp. TaxID=59823 RepID=UPI003077559E